MPYKDYTYSIPFSKQNTRTAKQQAHDDYLARPLSFSQYDQADYEKYMASLSPPPKESMKVETKTTGAPITKEEFKLLKKGDVFVHNKNNLKVFDHFADKSHTSHQAIATDKVRCSIDYIRWPTKEEYLGNITGRAKSDNEGYIKCFECKIDIVSECFEEHCKTRHQETMIPLTDDLLRNMKKGDLFFNIGCKGETYLFDRYEDYGNTHKIWSENGMWHSPKQVLIMKNTKETDQTTKENTMNNMVKEGCVSKAVVMVKTDAMDAAWRVAAKQTIKSAKAPLVAFLGNQKLPMGVAGFIVSQLDTDNGEAALAFVLGTGMTYLPQFASDANLSRLAKELRVMAMDTVFSKVADVMLNPLRAQLVEIVKQVSFTTPDTTPTA